jgi:hypothetical protein
VVLGIPEPFKILGGEKHGISSGGGKPVEEHRMTPGI